MIKLSRISSPQKAYKSVVVALVGKKWPVIFRVVKKPLQMAICNCVYHNADAFP
jgi:hypothetical protein